MARKHPILSLIVIAFTLMGLISFAKSFKANPTLSQIKQFETSNDHIDHTPHSDKDVVNVAHHGDGSQISQPQGSHTSITVAGPSPAAVHNSGDSSETSQTKGGPGSGEQAQGLDTIIEGKPIMAKMPNQTIRAEVGRAGWKMLHTILAQYPEEPTAEEKQTLSDYIKLFSRVYPCRECAEHFQELLKKYPPQVASRKNAVMWGCQAHNDVNIRLNKTTFDCAYIFEEYDCGCGPSEEEKAKSKPKSDSAELQKGG